MDTADSVKMVSTSIKSMSVQVSKVSKTHLGSRSLKNVVQTWLIGIMSLRMEILIVRNATARLKVMVRTLYQRIRSELRATTEPHEKQAVRRESEKRYRPNDFSLEKAAVL